MDVSMADRGRHGRDPRDVSLRRDDGRIRVVWLRNGNPAHPGGPGRRGRRPGVGTARGLVDRGEDNIVSQCSRCFRVALAGVLTAVGAAGCVDLGFTDRVLWRVTSPDKAWVAVCQEVPGFDGPGYDVRLEQQDGALIRRLYTIGDGDPCTEVVWSPDGRTLAVLSGHVARVRFVDVGWALDHPETRTAYWSWRQVDLSAEGRRLEGAGLRFVGAATVELQVHPARTSNNLHDIGVKVSVRRFDIPLPIVTGHR